MYLDPQHCFVHVKLLDVKTYLWVELTHLTLALLQLQSLNIQEIKILNFLGQQVLKQYLEFC